MLRDRIRALDGGPSQWRLFQPFRVRLRIIPKRQYFGRIENVRRVSQFSKKLPKAPNRRTREKHAFEEGAEGCRNIASRVSQLSERDRRLPAFRGISPLL